MVLRIFVTTDNHVGCHERNEIRRNDSSDTFEEALSIAQSQNCDLVLQCGDLFDKNRPSKQAMYSVLKSLRRHCLGDKPVEFEVLNHDRFSWEDDSDEFNYPNFEDQNINVALPVFAISGNHDDSGSSEFGAGLSPLDTLSMSGLINHFGRVHNNTQIVVTPILIQKENIKVAIYGIANVRDERLYRTFRDNNVKFRRPRDDPDVWYNILILHQNHVSRDFKNFSPEQLVPSFFDLVIWGHEHECRIDPVLNELRGFHVMQPGSSVATSFHVSEASPKYVAIVTIDGKKSMKCEKFFLKTVRPYVLKTVSLMEDAPHLPINTPASRVQITNWLIEQIEQLILQAQEMWDENHDTNDPPMLPLVRLRVDYTGGYEVENSVRFGSRFEGRVANPEDILHLVKKRQSVEKSNPFQRQQNINETMRDENTADISVQQVTKLMREHLKKEKPVVLLENGMREALRRFVEKEENDALLNGISSLIKKKQDLLKEGGNDGNFARHGEADLEQKSSPKYIVNSERNEPSGELQMDQIALKKDSPVISTESFVEIEESDVDLESITSKINPNITSGKISTTRNRHEAFHNGIPGITFSSKPREPVNKMIVKPSKPRPKRSTRVQIPELEVSESVCESDSSDVYSPVD